MPFLLDSDSLIQPKNLYYRFSFCPGFWDWIQGEHTNQVLFSVLRVKDELKEGADELATWATTAIPASFFIAPTTAVATTQATVVRWVEAQGNYSAAEKAKFLGGADPWLIAEALVNSQEIVTFEKLMPEESKKVKIPNVAQNFGVRCANLFNVLEGTGAQLHL